MHNFSALPVVEKGDKVAVLSPSSGLAGKYPWILNLGLSRMIDDFGLIPIEYPTTRQLHASPQDRANDVNAAFANPDIRAIFATIGGNDQIKLLSHIDSDVIKKNPKPFFGYSDSTNLMQLFWNLGIPSFYGGAVMTQFAMQCAMFGETKGSLQYALTDRGEKQIYPSSKFTDIDIDWADETKLYEKRFLEDNEGWYWDGTGEVSGTLWGGCVESLLNLLSSDICIPNRDTLNDYVLFIETAEGIPDNTVIEDFFTALGERGLLADANCILVGRPKAWSLEKQQNRRSRELYRKLQRETVLKSVREYNETATIVQNVDFGHTEPQYIVPMGNVARVNSEEKSIFFTY